MIILLAYNSPKPAAPGANTTAGGWYISGGNMAAPMAGELLEDILGYLGVEKTYSATADVLVPNLTGRTLADATASLKKNNLTLRTVGDGRHRHRPDPRSRGLHPRRQPGGALHGRGGAHRPGDGAQRGGPHSGAGPGEDGRGRACT